MIKATSDEPILIRYGEIGIKSPRVRRRFEKRLVSNINNIITGNVELTHGRIFLYPKNQKKALESLGKIFGVVSYSPTVSTSTDYDSIKQTLQNYVGELLQEGLFSGEESFAIRCRRVGTHEFTSQEMAAYCGAVVVEETDAPVDLSHPDFEIYVEVREDRTYIYHEKLPGLGGLPIGTQGKVVTLLSDGIDSPVAAFLMMKRGCAVTLLHFNNYPYTSGSMDKFNELVNKLREYSSGSKIVLYTLDYGEFLKTCLEKAPPRMTCVLCKSGMYHLAEKLALQEDALAIVDGSNLGQVASQTLPNILATRQNIEIPILSPLIGFDKMEIQDLAGKIGTYEISILPDSGCQAVPRHPETNADAKKVLQAEEEIQMPDELEEIFKTLEKHQ